MPVSGRGPYDPQNIFARILRGELPCERVFENSVALAFHDIAPQAPVHLLVIPKGDYVSFADFSAAAPAATVAAFFAAVGEVARALGLEDRGYRLIANMGPDSGQAVPHFHVHILAGRDLGSALVPAAA